MAGTQTKFEKPDLDSADAEALCDTLPYIGVNTS
jgi:hypothetical protein